MRATLNRIALLVLTGLAPFAWQPGGRAQTGCIIEGGIDPLDVLKVTVKHNVFIGLDNSGTMSRMFNGSNPPQPWPNGIKEDHPLARLRLSKEVLKQIINDPDLNDAQGNPLVNWGFFFTAQQNDGVGITDPNSDACAVPQRDADNDFVHDAGCEGLDETRVPPSFCGEPDSKDAVLQMLEPFSNGGIENNGGTANGVSMDQIAGVIRRDYVPKLLPGQKNFIIYVTDGFEDCQCREHVIDFPGAGQINPPALRTSTNKSDPNQSFNPVGTSDTRLRFYNAGIKAQHSLRTIDPDLDGSKGDIFMLLIGQDSQAIVDGNVHWGWEASGASLGRQPCGPNGGIGCARPGGHASTPDEMVDAIKNVLLQIGVPTANVSLGTSVVGSVKEVVADSKGANPPDLTHQDFVAADAQDREVLKRRGIYTNNVLFSTSVETPGFRGHLRAHNIYKEQDDGTRVADFTELWDAGKELSLRDLDSDPRRILFNRDVAPGSTPPPPLAFDASNVSPSDLGVSLGFLKELDPAGLGARSDSDARDIVVKVLQGYRLVSFSPLQFTDLNADGTGTWKLFEAANSGPAVVLNPPRSPELDPPEPATEYATFYNDYINRLTVVYLATNGGMIHAFRGDTGRELYGYIPPDLLPKLANLVRNVVADSNGLVNHEYFIASSPTVQDVYMRTSVNGQDEWRTVLTFGRGRGGKFITALDVTDVGVWSGSTATVTPSPRLIFNVGNRDGVTDDDPNGETYDELGQTWSVPLMARVQDPNGDVAGQWVVFAGSGYGCPGSEEGKYFYVLKLEDGTIYRKFGPIQDVVGPADPGIDQNALVATPTLYNPHEWDPLDPRDYVDRAYIGDLQGFIYKLDASSPDPASWGFGVFFELTSQADQDLGQGNHDQPITAPMALLKLSGADEILLFAGTGGDERVQLAGTEAFKVAGIVDYESTPSSFDGKLITINSGPNQGGVFFYDVPTGERVSVGPVTAKNLPTNGVVFFASSAKEFQPATCSQAFTSTLFAFGATTGAGTYDMDPSTTGVEGEITDIQGKITGLFHRDEHLYVSNSGGIGIDGGTEVRGKADFSRRTSGGSNIQVLIDNFRMSPF